MGPSLSSKSTSMTSFFSYRVRHTAELTLIILLALRTSLLSCPLLCLYLHLSSLSRHLKSAETMLECARETKSTHFLSARNIHKDYLDCFLTLYKWNHRARVT